MTGCPALLACFCNGLDEMQLEAEQWFDHSKPLKSYQHQQAELTSQEGCFLVEIDLPGLSFLEPQKPVISTLSVELHNFIKALLTSNSWCKNTLVLHIFVLLIPSLFVMVHDTFLIYLLVAALLPGRANLLWSFRNAQVVTCTMKINSSYAKESCILMVSINTDIMGLRLHPHPELHRL